jgi:hypothetical protein
MHGLFDKQIGAEIIKNCCKPLKNILTDHSIGRFLQFFHIFGYIVAVFLIIFYPITRLIIFILFLFIIFMFYIFDGCILTRAEIDLLGKSETTPGLVLDIFHLRPSNKETDKYVQKVGSIAVLVVPIIFILIVEISK